MLVRGRQDDAEDGSAASRAGDRDVAAGQARELARDRQPEAGTAFGLRAVSGLEQVPSRLGAQARAVVPDLDEDAAVGGIQTDIDQVRAPGAVLERVGG